MSKHVGGLDGAAAYDRLDAGAEPWSIDRISAVTLAVREMAEAVAFYQRIGFRVSHSGPHAPFTTLRACEAVVNLRQAVVGAGHASNRLILRVRGVDALYRDLLEKGLAPTEPRDAEWGERFCELADPQGVVISFAEVH